jgi:microsomal dipeptidase-like Zn-dependent dipeptidase
MKHYIDLHCHPSIKPFGRACPGNTNNHDASLKNSLWHDDPPSTADKMITLAPTFSQSNFTALFQGNFKVVIVALNPVEKGFFTSKPGTGNGADSIYNYTTGIGKKKVDFIQQNKDDFNELLCEYEFYLQLHKTPMTIYGKKVCYRLTSEYANIAENLNRPDNVISVVMSIEGGYTFNNDNSRPPVHSLVMANIDKVKKWDYPPFFVTFCHHFYNYLGGHARSLPSGMVSRYIDQNEGIDNDITPLGIDVIHRLLSKTGERRIYIDIKHMSRKVRIAYYDILQKDYSGEQIPIIVSHGAVNGYESVYDFNVPEPDRKLKFSRRDINFYDDEIIKIYDSGGIFGLQIDKRQLTNNCEKRKIKFQSLWNRNKRLKLWTAQVWNQIGYIADLLDSNDRRAWDITSLGTDFDGITSPIAGYWTSAEIPLLYTNLHVHAQNYLRNKIFRVPANNITADAILEKVFSENAMTFLSKYYKP